LLFLVQGGGGGRLGSLEAALRDGEGAATLVFRPSSLPGLCCRAFLANLAWLGLVERVVGQYREVASRLPFPTQGSPSGRERPWGAEAGMQTQTHWTNHTNERRPHEPRCAATNEAMCGGRRLAAGPHGARRHSVRAHGSTNFRGRSRRISGGPDFWDRWYRATPPFSAHQMKAPSRFHPSKPPPKREAPHPQQWRRQYESLESFPQRASLFTRSFAASSYSHRNPTADAS